jgi:V-type H+-transporting ATPase subunit a
MAQLFAHRFLILAMGAFAVYAGVMYTEFFAIGVNFFGSKWSCPDDGTGRHSVECEPLNGAGEGPYPVGLDPAWSIASNQLLFVNSMKMKISVLFGVAQMLLGVGLKFANSVYFRNKTDFLFECIPQLAFMLALFAYMDWMIMYKWVTPMAAPPGLIDTMITLGLTGGDVRQELYAGQAAVQAVLFKIGIWSVPLMLIPKPLILWLQHRFGRGSGYSSVHAEDDTVGLISGGGGHTGGHAGSGGHGGAGHGGVGHDKEEFEIGEIAIHQAIETIEFVLGTVSHTASYLRLWALSLAHQQLSLVFLKKTLFASLNMLPVVLNGISIYIGFSAFLVVTAGILLGMDVMECFLHTLRLHWVEFQSKFYKADGIKFRPFSHRSNVADVETSP